MGMYISIADGTGLVTSTGIFECIVEETRSLFKDSEQGCVKEIYMSLDEWCQTFIALDDIDAECFNLFYSYCEKAMVDFPNSERGKIPDKEYLPVILGEWSEVLRIMREDPRYRGEQQA